LGGENLSKAEVYIGYDTSPGGKPAPVPAVASGSKNLLSWVEPVPNQPLSFRARGASGPVNLIPLYKLFGERYAVYWTVPRAS
jgi:hypothetical protein